MSPLDRLGRALGLLIAALLAVTAMLVGALLLGVPIVHAEPSYSCGTECNGQVPSFDNPSCWPRAVACPPADAPEDVTVCGMVDGAWVSAASATLGQPCAWGQR